MPDHKLDELVDRIGDAARHTTRPRAGLTQRERDVIACAAHGLNVTDTAARLGVSYETVRHHRKLAIRHLHARTLTHAVAIALSDGSIAAVRPLSGG